MRDFYEILQVDKTASEDEIKRAYRQLAKKYHPDLNPDDEEAEKNFKEATQAYEVLSNSEMRGRYDRYGHAGIDPQAQGFGGGFGGFEDIFEDIFDVFGGGFGGGYSRSSRRTGPERGADMRYDLTLDFKDAIFGVEREIQIRRTEECTGCQGSGAEEGSDISTCTTCNGTGQVRQVERTILGHAVSTATCPTCAGSGQIIEDKCKVCHGAGTEMKSRKISVKIPAGVDNGSIISLRGEGEHGKRGGPPGDLYVYIRVNEDPVFIRHADDIYLEIPISFTEAALGAEIEVPTLEGVEKYTIPAGTQTASQFRLKNQGVPHLRGMGKGDLIFQTNIYVPEKLNDKQKELLKEFAEVSGQEIKKGKKGFFNKVKDAFN